MSKLFTTGEACKKIGCSRVSLHNWICSGRIQAPSVQPGRTRVLWSAEDIENVRIARKHFVSLKGRVKFGVLHSKARETQPYTAATSTEATA